MLRPKATIVASTFRITDDWKRPPTWVHIVIELCAQLQREDLWYRPSTGFSIRGSGERSETAE